jgi:hypothetical protein
MVFCITDEALVHGPIEDHASGDITQVKKETKKTKTKTQKTTKEKPTQPLRQ